MTNHFHFLVYIPENVEISKLSNEIKILLRSYTRAINKQENRIGSLFTQNTRSKTVESNEYIFSCFNYIHQNPMKARLVTKMEDWEFSSFRDYIGLRNGKLVSKEDTMKYIEMPNSPEQFYTQSYLNISEEVLSKIL